MAIFDNKTRRKKAELSEFVHYSSAIEQAQVLIAIYLDKEESYDRTKDVQSIGACCQNIWLAAHSLGLGTVWNGEILNYREDVNKVLRTSEKLELMAIFCIGFPKEEPNSNRKPIEDLLIK